MRSHRIAGSVADRARGVIRIERLDHPATTSSPGRAAGEFTASLDEVLAFEHVHLYRQSMRPDGTTREYLIDVDGTGLGFVEGRDPPPFRAAPAGSLHPPARSEELRSPVRGLVRPTPAPLAGSPRHGPAAGPLRGPRREQGLQPRP